LPPTSLLALNLAATPVAEIKTGTSLRPICLLANELHVNCAGGYGAIRRRVIRPPNKAKAERRALIMPNLSGVPRHAPRARNAGARQDHLQMSPPPLPYPALPADAQAVDARQTFRATLRCHLRWRACDPITSNRSIHMIIELGKVTEETQQITYFPEGPDQEMYLRFT
jgi:hypothetical protein